jgi:hypothetical protein
MRRQGDREIGKNTWEDEEIRRWGDGEIGR